MTTPAPRWRTRPEGTAEVRPTTGDCMILVNTETIPGHRIVDLKGLVQGNTIRAKDIGRDIGASLKNLVGGEIRAYTDLMTEARREAVQRMVEQARQLGANAVVNVRFTTSQVAGGAAELYAYGTAVLVEPEEGEELEDTVGPGTTFDTSSS